MDKARPTLEPMSESKGIRTFAGCLLAVVLLAIFADYGKEVSRLNQEVRLRALERGCVLMEGLQ